MSGGAHRGHDDISFFAADIGETRKLAANAGSPTQSTDAEGPLSPGRWLIYVDNIASDHLVWVGFGKFEAGVALPSPVGPGAQRAMLSPRTFVGIETVVYKGYNDRCCVQTDSSTCNVYLTRVSR